MEQMMQKIEQKMKQKMERTRELVVQVTASLRGGQTPDDEGWEKVGLEDAAGMEETTAQPGVSAEAQRLKEEAKEAARNAWETTSLAKISPLEREAYHATCKAFGEEVGPGLLNIYLGEC